VGLQFEVDEAGMQAKFRKKLRSLVVTVPVIRDLRPQLKPVQPDGSPAMAVSLKDGDYYGSNGSEQEEARARLPASAEQEARQVPSMAMGLEDDDYGGYLHEHDAAPGETGAVVADVHPPSRAGGGSCSYVIGGHWRSTGQDVEARGGREEASGGGSVSAEQGHAAGMLEHTRVMAVELKDQGNKFVKEGKHAQALVLYEQAIALWDQDPAAYTNRALCHTKSGNFEAAIADCRACLKIDPMFVRAHERLGAVYEAQKDFSAALAEYQAGLALDPSHQGCTSGARSAAKHVRSPAAPGAAPKKATSFSFANKPAAATSPPPSAAVPAASSKTTPSATTAAAPSSCTASSARDSSTPHKCILDALSAYQVEVKSVARRGRCVFAKGAIGRGQVVLEARPMAYAVNDKYNEEVCHYCFGLLPAMKAMQFKCSGGCGGVVYCRKQCAEADKLHQISECQVLKTVKNVKSTRGLRVFLKAVYMYAGDKGMAQLSELLEADEGAEEDANNLGMAQAVNRFVMEEAHVLE
jgi:tetratricopeptide (TPR) repeat protein